MSVVRRRGRDRVGSSRRPTAHGEARPLAAPVRVIAGSARGRRLSAPPGRHTRPTSDRVREALFSALSAELADASVLDLFAGSGALGIEALSRGADHTVFVERDADAVQVIAANLEHTGLSDSATVLHGDAARFCRGPHRRGPFTLVLVDPPYAQPLASVYRMLDDLRRSAGLAPGATIVVERDRRDPALDAATPDWLAGRRQRSYGDTVLLFLRAEDEPGRAIARPPAAPAAPPSPSDPRPPAAPAAPPSPQEPRA